MPYPTLLEQPDYGADVVAKPSVDVVRFGDGYSQDLDQGINNNPQTTTLRFKRRPAEAQALYKWFLANRSRFFWTPPDEVTPILWSCVNEIRKTYDNAGWSTVSVTLEERFDPDMP